MRSPQFRVGLEPAFKSKLVVDLFAGGGGASTGIEAAINRPCDIAINHDPKAIAMHRVNHPETRHYTEDVWKVDPREACGGVPVGLVWVSPDCTHFSRASGKPKKRGKRDLAWSIVRWAKAVGPDVFVMENVPEIADWGPLGPDGLPDKSRKGLSFNIWVGRLRGLGYSVEWEVLNAADYGAPTNRKRLFLVARRDGARPNLPAPTHSKEQHVPASEIINWDHEVPSIFTRKKQLAEPTLRRIAHGIHRYVHTDTPFIVRHGHYSKRTGAGIVQGAGAGLWRGQTLDKPLATVCATNDKNLVIPWIVQHNGGMVGQSTAKTLGTITAKCQLGLGAALLAPPGHVDRSERVTAFLLKYYGTAIGQSVARPLGTITSKSRFALVMVHGEPYRIVDIGMRMLQPDELYGAQGFPTDYEYETGIGEHGEEIRFTKTDQIKYCGNSVSPPPAHAIVAEHLAQ
jgi:DNA (cytosine-5)-methyltransferase 1